MMVKERGDDSGELVPGIKSVGHWVPERVVTNGELAERLNTSDEWIVTHTGIHERHIAEKGQAASDLGFSAASEALGKASIPGKKIDLLIVATTTPDYQGFPSTACVLQKKLGCIGATAFDITAACSGFVYSLGIAHSMMKAQPNQYKTALVVGSEVLSSITNWEDRSTCVLFGDGAGAAVLDWDPGNSRILDWVLGADGSGAEKLIVPEGGSRKPVTAEQLQGEQPLRNKIEMNGRAVYEFAVDANHKVINLLLERNGLQLDDLSCIVPHQANERILKTVSKRYQIPMDLFFVNIGSYANTSGASIPIALCEMEREQKLKKGDLLLTVGFGAGLTYGGNILRW